MDFEAALRGRKKSLRVGAWALAPYNDGGRTRSEEKYADCDRCVRGRVDAYHEQYQREQRCCFISRAEWEPAQPRGRYMGAPTIYEGDLVGPDVAYWVAHGGNAEEPIETLEDGCPGSWYRCPWYDSVMPYVRSCSGDGVRSENLLLTRCDDPLVLEAVHYFELEQNRHRPWYHDEAERNRPQPQG